MDIGVNTMLSFYWMLRQCGSTLGGCFSYRAWRCTDGRGADERGAVDFRVVMVKPLQAAALERADGFIGSGGAS
ncbi:hypothetical protein KCP77_15665 [Salmonella enterica subsp. enterica]|nr:hypothetical protein KCP77_15665 [Salmonella enterica subsp. enterica]